MLVHDAALPEGFDNPLNGVAVADAAVDWYCFIRSQKSPTTVLGLNGGTISRTTSSTAILLSVCAIAIVIELDEPPLGSMKAR